MMLRRLALAAPVAALCMSVMTAPAAAEPRIVALTETDEAAYRDAFTAIETRDWRGVRAALNRVEDDVLVGAVRGRMLLAPAYRPSWAEMTAWLDRYGDYGMASAIYDRAIESRRRRSRARPPSVRPGPTRVLPGAGSSPPGDSAAYRVAIARIADRVGSGDDSGARDLALSALNGPRAGQAHWWLGLIAYRAQNYAEARGHFEQASQWPHHNAWAKSAAHYWAARALLAAGEARGVARHLDAAANLPWTFYGQLAEAQLGRDTSLDFTPPELDPEALRAMLDRHPSARRAAALAQLGRLSEVESELRRLHADLASPEEDRTYLALATLMQAPSAQLRAAEYGGTTLAAGYCPVNSFEPEDGFSLDRALIYAIVRQESRFNPVAVSSSNARGLMQLLPSTANDIDRAHGFRRYPAKLFDPGLNMRLGQAYVRWLMEQFHNDGDLGEVFAAYNGGPGWLQRWLAVQPSTNDPLLILETLSREESRDYAERVLSHMALCRKSFGQPTPEIDQLANGRPAAYAALDTRLAGAAQNRLASQQD